MSLLSFFLPGARGLRLWLCLAILVGCFLARTFGLSDAGLVDDDSAYYTIFGEYYRKLLFTDYPMYFALDIAYKPGFFLVSTLSAIVFGYSEYMLPLTNACIAVGISLAVYRLAQLITAVSWVPVLAMAAVTFAPFLIRLDRMGLSHTAATLMLLLSIHQLLQWARYSWEGPRSLLRRAGLLLGCAFLFHPTVLIYCLTLGAVVTFQALLQYTRPLLRRLLTPLSFAGWAFLPLLCTDLIYRALFRVFPLLSSGHSAKVFGAGYFSDVVGGFGMASISGEGVQDPAFALKALALFGRDPTDYLSAVAIVAGLGLLLWRIVRGERLWAYLFIATVPLLMMSFNPYVGQYARALHATLPMLLIAAAAALGLLVETVSALRNRQALIFSIVILALSVAQVGSYARNGQFEKPAKRAEMALPRNLLSALKDAGLEKTYIYYSGFYAIHWFYYQHKYFGALPFLLQNGGLQPPADYRMILTIPEVGDKIRSGAADVVLISRMIDDRVIRLWNGHAKEDAFIAFAEKTGAPRLTQIGDYTVPDYVYVYDFRSVRERVGP